MKIKARIFLLLATIILLIVPIINYQHNNMPMKDWRQWLNKSKLYNLDFALPSVGRILYAFGISLSPKQVVIGKNDWLFIGDRYSNSITNLRTGIDQNDTIQSTRIMSATNSWNQWFRARGITQYQIMLVADKQTVYKEFLPQWIEAAPASLTNNLLTAVDKDIYLDTRSALNKAKSDHQFPLYYKTDSHWNLLGGWVAYEALSGKLSLTNPSLRWLTQEEINIETGVPRGSGDLASFLWLTNIIGEHEVSVKIKPDIPLKINTFNLETGVLSQYSDQLRYHYTTPPVLIHSANAFNKKKVLFLVDSFGNYLSQYMSATFSDTLQIHYGGLNASSLAQAVDTFKPDYVIAAVVERDARTGIFLEFPPSPVFYDNSLNYQVQSSAKIGGINHLVPIDSNQHYKISGEDPYIHYILSNKIDLQNLSKLAVGIHCQGEDRDIPIQLFWSTDKSDILESNSMRANFKNGVNILDITRLGINVTKPETLSSLRLDIDIAPNSCTKFHISQFDLVK